MTSHTERALAGLGAGAVVLDRFGHAWQQAGPAMPGFWYRAYANHHPVTSRVLAAYGPITVLTADPAAAISQPAPGVGTVQSSPL